MVRAVSPRRWQRFPRVPFAGEASAAADTAKAAKIGAEGADALDAASNTARAIDFTKTAAQATLKATFDPGSLVPFEKLPAISDLSNLIKNHFGTNIDTTGINNLDHIDQVGDAELAKLPRSDQPDARVGARTPASDNVAVGHSAPQPAPVVRRDTSEHLLAGARSVDYRETGRWLSPQDTPFA